jgi:hypothetical protein
VQLLLKNVRSFCARQSIPVRPLTLLVGENSTGKSTFLAMLAHVSDFRFTSLRPSFNENPFKLGTYDSIATFKGGRFGRAPEFSVGWIEDKHRCITSTYVSYKGQPQLSSLEATLGPSSFVLKIDSETLDAELRIRSSRMRSDRFRFSLKGRVEVEAEGPMWYMIRRLAYEQRAKKSSRALGKLLDEIIQ